jgi:EAL domain-containing protein (putative c-di-GMP-specific phosphodiesterase class I)
MQANVPPLPLGLEDPLNLAVAVRDRDIVKMVRDAVTHRQTLLAFQPVMQARAPDREAFHEGLIRILDPSGRIIPARDFLPAVQDSELGREIDVLSLRLGLRTLHDNPDLRLSINMSARSIGYKPWLQTLRRFLHGNRALGERLILEISESSAMMVPELVVNLMDDLQPQGVCFALDQFGAGYMAIRYFRDFFFDILKIDGQFIRGIAADADNRNVTAALISVARQFDMLTVAENVENAADAEVLTQMGVDCLQGYYFSAPTTVPPWLTRDQRQRA